MKEISTMKLKFVALPVMALALLIGCEKNPHKTTDKYTQLEVPLNVPNLAPVTEVFSLSCGHCRSMVDELPKIEEIIDTKIQKEHITFNESAMFAALIYYTAAIQQNGNASIELTKNLFEFVQDGQKETVEENKAAISSIFEKIQLTSPYDLNEKQKEALFAALERADLITEQSQITSVPTFIVNGKYVINTSAHESAEELSETIKHLLKQSNS